jgi:hypothetical protein
MADRQNVLILYLADSALDSAVIAWSRYEGDPHGAPHMAGDADEPPYQTGLAALRDGWRLLQMSQLLPHAPGSEFTTSYLKYEFLFERWVHIDDRTD